MGDGGEPEAGGDADEGTDATGAVECGAFGLNGFGVTDFAIGGGVDGLLGGEHAAHGVAPLGVTAVANFLPQVSTHLGQQRVVVTQGDIFYFNPGGVG